MHLELLYCPFGTDNVFKNPFNPNFSLTSLEKALKGGDGTANGIGQKKRDVIVRGVLSVTVISAEDLPIVDMMGKADPYVVVLMKKSETKNKTRVRQALFISFFILYLLKALFPCPVEFGKS